MGLADRGLIKRKMPNDTRPKTKNIPFRKIPKVGKDETMLGMLLAMGDTIPS